MNSRPPRDARNHFVVTHSATDLLTHRPTNIAVTTMPQNTTSSGDKKSKAIATPSVPTLWRPADEWGSTNQKISLHVGWRSITRDLCPQTSQMSEANIKANVIRLQQVLLWETRPQVVTEGTWMACFQLLDKQNDLEEVVQTFTRIASDSAFPDCTFTIQATLRDALIPQKAKPIFILSVRSPGYECLEPTLRPEVLAEEEDGFQLYVTDRKEMRKVYYPPRPIYRRTFSSDDLGEDEHKNQSLQSSLRDGRICGSLWVQTHASLWRERWGNSGADGQARMQTSEGGATECMPRADHAARRQSRGPVKFGESTVFQ